MQLDLPRPATLSDEEAVERVLSGEHALFEILIRRHNQRVYRVARAVVKDEAEDVMQEAYVKAWRNLRQFEGRSRFATWLTRIAVREAIARRLYAFHLYRCDRVVERVFRVIAAETSNRPPAA